MMRHCKTITSVFSSARKIAAEEDSLKGTESMFHSLAPVNSMDRIPYLNIFFLSRKRSPRDAILVLNLWTWERGTKYSWKRTGASLFDNHKQKKAIAAVECHQSLEILDWQKSDQSDQFLKQKS